MNSRHREPTGMSFKASAQPLMTPLTGKLTGLRSKRASKT